MKKQVYNPYLPLNVYTPDGEPHVFGDRIYIYGSHDMEGGNAFCLLDYEVWSAPVCDLTDWRCEGTIYSAKQDPDYGEEYKCLYAPDVVKGNDGKYYLYYAMSGGKKFTGAIHAAVCDSPAGKYEYYGYVKNSDGTPFTRNITFDPAVLNDNGKIRLYYGWSLSLDKHNLEKIRENDEGKKQLLDVESALFGKSREEILSEPYGIMGAFTVETAEDMLTVTSEPKLIIPCQLDSLGSGFECHAFFEASSVRKINGKYYFIYSSEKEHELCYATSDFPDKNFSYGGVIISNGDIGYNGRTEADRAAITGNNHGCIERINGSYYVFYHRQTHKTSFSRQGCAEKITLNSDGSIPQVEMTSCGLNGKPLEVKGRYPAVIACILTNHHMPHTVNNGTPDDIPYITNSGEDRFISDIKEDTEIGYKYFEFKGKTNIKISVRGNSNGKFLIFCNDNKVGEIKICSCDNWTEYGTKIDFKGTAALYFRYSGSSGSESCQFLNFTFD